MSFVLAVVLSLVLTVAALASGLAWFHYARHDVVPPWWRGPGARPCACARVVFPVTLTLLGCGRSADAHTRAGHDDVAAVLVAPTRCEGGPTAMAFLRIMKSRRRRPCGQGGLAPAAPSEQRWRLGCGLQSFKRQPAAVHAVHKAQHFELCPNSWGVTSRRGVTANEAVPCVGLRSAREPHGRALPAAEPPFCYGLAS